MSCTATIKWFNAKKGFGFAGPEGGGDDIFVHVANIKKDDEGNAPYLDEGDTIYYNTGEHNGKVTAMDVTVPIGTEKKRPPRRRGRNATKAADADSEKIADEQDEAALDKAKPESAEPAAAGAGGGTGGRDGKTHRRPNSGNRSRRNDKGVGLNGKPKPNSGPRGDGKKSEAKDAARNSGTAAAE